MAYPISQTDILKPLLDANAKDSDSWLAVNSPDHYEAVQKLVALGVKPDAIYHCVYRDTFRHELAHRCRLAARYLWSQEETGD
jgi:hypothetical protein